MKNSTKTISILIALVAVIISTQSTYSQYKAYTIITEGLSSYSYNDSDNSWKFFVTVEKDITHFEFNTGATVLTLYGEGDAEVSTYTIKSIILSSETEPSKNYIDYSLVSPVGEKFELRADFDKNKMRLIGTYSDGEPYLIEYFIKSIKK